MGFRPKVVEDQLRGKFGFVDAKEHADDHRWIELQLGDRHILTKVSHNRKEIGDLLEQQMSKQLRVRQSYFRQMIACTKSKDEYYRQVRANPYPPDEAWRFALESKASKKKTPKK